MRKDIHPEYGPVIFRDRSARAAFLTRSTIRSDQTMVWTDGQTYPVCDVDVSAASHPYWTGKGRVLDTVGRVEAFERRYGRGERR